MVQYCILKCLLHIDVYRHSLSLNFNNIIGTGTLKINVKTTESVED